MKSLHRALIVVLINFDPDWNLMYSNYQCKECFWLDLGLGQVHYSHNG